QGPDALRPEARARPVGGAAVEGHAEHRGIVLAGIAHVLDIGRLEERVDAGVMRQLAAREGRDALVLEAVGARQAHLQRPLALGPPGRAERRLRGRPRRSLFVGAGLVPARAALGRGDEGRDEPGPYT